MSQIARSASSPALVLSMDARQRILSSKGTEIEVWPHLTLCQDRWVGWVDWLVRWLDSILGIMTSLGFKPA